MRHVGAIRCVILLLGFEFGTWSAKPALVKALVDRVFPFRRLVFGDLPPQMPGALVMKRLRRPHKDVVATVLSIEAKIVKHPLQLA